MNYKFKPSHLIPSYLFVVAVLYGGSKPPSTTNEPPDDISSPTNAPTMLGLGLRPRSTMEGNILCTPTPSTYTSLTAWNKRGAFCDWLRVDFPSSFAFPSGTNLLTGVTLMAYGEIRESVAGELVCSFVGLDDTQSTNQPTNQQTNQLVFSIEPDVSSVSYGLTPSNSFLFTWQNVCVNRSPTNRVDASIELFRNGDLAITVTPLSSPSTSTFAYQPAVPPAGFVGSGQDTNWLASVFAPTDYAQITNKGYNAWLDEDYVGVNEQNGHYRADITVASLPDNGVPCYLVCGPYNVVVNQPGTYSFPLEVFEHYRTRTYPVALPLAISTDDGYRSPQFSNSPVLMASRPRLALSAPPSTSPEYDICEQPRLVLSPSRILLSQAAGAVISIWCNISEGASRLYSSLSGLTTVSFTCPSEAEIEESMVADAVEFILETSKGSCSGVVSIEDDHDGNDIPPYHWCCWWCCGNSCSCDGTCCPCDCGCHSGTNGVPPSVTP